jgi:hypothetical protein
MGSRFRVRSPIQAQGSLEGSVSFVTDSAFSESPESLWIATVMEYQEGSYLR